MQVHMLHDKKCPVFTYVSMGFKRVFSKNIYLAKDQCIDSGFRDWMAELAPEVQIL